MVRAKAGARAFSSRILIYTALILVSPSALPSQTRVPPSDGQASTTPIAVPAETIRVRVREVSLVLSVTDHKGKFVNNLSPTDLTILDNGVEQSKLTFFENTTDMPIKVALVVDVSASVAYRFAAEKKAIESFLRKVARPSDSVMLFAFNQSVQLKSPVTNNWEETVRRVKAIDPQGETALYDAVLSASDWLGGNDSNVRRVMILITDGEENKSQAGLDDAINTALMAEASIYSIDVSAEGTSEDAKRGMRILQSLSAATGGAYTEAIGDESVADALVKIRRELRSEYALAYTPSNPGTQQFHRLEVLVPKRLRVHCRSGYYVK